MRAGSHVAVTLLAAHLAPSLAMGRPAAKPVVVFEAHVGRWPATTARVLRAVKSLLEARGYAASPAAVLRLAGTNLPRPGILDPGLTSSGLAELHSKAFATYKAAQWGDTTDWGDAIPLLVEARDKTVRNPALVANDIGNLDLMFQTLVALADCHQRSGNNAAAVAAMKEVRRLYPTRPVSRTDAWGPSGEQLYMRVMLDDRAALRGRLSISAGDPNAQIAVEGQPRGVGNVSLRDLFPGVYHVFIRTSVRTSGRQYIVTVKAGEETRVTADIDRDESLDVSDESVALTYLSENARKDECTLATQFAAAWSGNGASLVLASGEERGRPTIVGKHCRDGVLVRRVVSFTDSGEASAPATLNAFIDDLTSSEPPPVGGAPVPSAGALWPALVLGTGALVLGGGATLYVVSQDDDRRSLAMAGYAGGASLAGVGVSWWLTKSRHLRPIPAAMVGASTTSLLLAAMFLPIDEDLDALGPQRPTIRDTAVSGTIFAGAGVGFAVASYLAWRSGRRVPSSSVSPSRRRDAPAGAAVASLIRTRDGAVFGVAGRF